MMVEGKTFLIFLSLVGKERFKTSVELLLMDVMEFLWTCSLFIYLFTCLSKLKHTHSIIDRQTP